MTDRSGSGAEGARSDGAAAGRPAFDGQFAQAPADYLAHIDFYTWTRHFHLLHDVTAHARDADVLEVGTGDGVLRRCAEPFVRSYTVMDINPQLRPEILADLSQHQPALVGRFDAAICAEVLEHLPFAAFSTCLGHLGTYLRPGGRLFLTLPHRKSHLLVVTPKQRLTLWRFPVGLVSASEAWNRFVRRKIWIDPHHCWEIGDGTVRRADVEAAQRANGFSIERFAELPYCDYWVLNTQPAA